MSSTNFYRFQSFPMLGQTKSFLPFRTQAYPIKDPLQKHFSFPQQAVVSGGYQRANDLSTQRFLGTVWQQQNEPKFLGANERVVFEDSW
jgi:hypothetical protein